LNSTVESLFQSLKERIAETPDLAGLNLPALALPSLRLVTQRARPELGESRIGGTPDAPPGFEWPRWTPPKQNRPVPLGFIAQIDLSAIPSFDDALPASGWLYFFYDRSSEPWGFDPADAGSCRVMHASCDRSALRRLAAPDDADPQHTAEPCAIDPRLELTLPDHVPGAEYRTTRWRRASRRSRRAHDACEALRNELSTSDGPSHRLRGHAQAVQGEMELECQLASNGVYCGNPEGYRSARAQALEPGAPDWRLLLQIDTDEDGPGWMWGDVGRIYFWLREQDLRNLRFDRAWLILQCC
jgi:uncharacterized protein YwqG